MICCTELQHSNHKDWFQLYKGLMQFTVYLKLLSNNLNPKLRQTITFCIFDDVLVQNNYTLIVSENPIFPDFSWIFPDFTWIFPTEIFDLLLTNILQSSARASVASQSKDRTWRHGMRHKYTTVAKNKFAFKWLNFPVISMVLDVFLWIHFPCLKYGKLYLLIFLSEWAPLQSCEEAELHTMATSGLTILITTWACSKAYASWGFCRSMLRASTGLFWMTIYERNKNKNSFCGYIQTKKKV